MVSAYSSPGASSTLVGWVVPPEISDLCETIAQPAGAVRQATEIGRRAQWRDANSGTNFGSPARFSRQDPRQTTWTTLAPMTGVSTAATARGASDAPLARCRPADFLPVWVPDPVRGPSSRRIARHVDAQDRGSVADRPQRLRGGRGFWEGQVGSADGYGCSWFSVLGVVMGGALKSAG